MEKKEKTTVESLTDQFLNPSEEQAYSQTFVEHGKNKEKSYFLSLLTHGMALIIIGAVIGLFVSLLLTAKWTFADSYHDLNSSNQVVTEEIFNNRTKFNEIKAKA